MKLERKVYETRAEKRRDFWIGFGGWYLVNILFYVLDSILLAWLPSGFALLSWIPAIVVNLGGLVVLAFTRDRIALGVLAAIGVALALAIVAGVVLIVACFQSYS